MIRTGGDALTACRANVGGVVITEYAGALRGLDINEIYLIIHLADNALLRP